MLKLIALAAAALLWLAPAPGQAAQPTQTETLRGPLVEVKHGRHAYRHPPARQRHWHRPPPRHHFHYRHPPPPPPRYHRRHYRPAPKHYYYHPYPAPQGGLQFQLRIPH